GDHCAGNQCLDASAGRASVMAAALARGTGGYSAPAAAGESVRARVGYVSAGGGGFCRRVSRRISLFAGLRFSVETSRTRKRREPGGTALPLPLHGGFGERGAGRGASTRASGGTAPGGSAAQRG